LFHFIFVNIITKIKGIIKKYRKLIVKINYQKAINNFGSACIEMAKVPRGMVYIIK